MAWAERDYYREERGGGFGSRLRGSSVVMWLIGINAAVFILDMILSSGMRTGALSPTAWGQFSVAEGIFGLQVWRWITYQFLHDGFFHVLFNLIALFFFGPMLESWWGSRRFLAFYLLCGMSGAVVYSLMVLLAPGVIFDVGRLASFGVTPRDIPIVGASGAIFGILAGAATLFPHQRVMLLIPPIPMSLRTMALIFLGIAALSLIAGSANAGGEAAHLGGALLGFLLVKNPRVLSWAERVDAGSWRESVNRRRRQRQRNAVIDEQLEVDRILDKVRQHGLQSLSRREKKTLNRATERQRRAG